MKNTSLKEVTIKLPKGLANMTSAKEIAGMVMDKAVTTAEYYRSRCKEFEQKYGTSLDVFKKKVESTKTENTAEWDDLLVWEGFALAYVEWNNKSKELRKCGA